MANMFDYLEWRADVPFSADPFNEVDNLILSELAYPEFPEHAAAVGILFFAMAAVLGVMIWRFRIVVRRERIAAAREQGLQESGQRAE